jgi:hypothetical protein
VMVNVIHRKVMVNHNNLLSNFIYLVG